MTRFQQMMLGSALATITAMVGLRAFRPGPPSVDLGRWATVEEPSTHVLFSGISPKEPRAYRPTPGTRADLVLELREAGSASFAGEIIFELDGRARIGVRTWIEYVDEAGNIGWRWAVRSAEVTADHVGGRMPADAWRVAVAGVKGMRGESRLDPQGHVLEHSRERGGTTAEDANLSMEVERILREPVPHLPDTALGERAQWQVRRVVLNDGVPTEVTETWKIAAMDDDPWQLEATFVAIAGATSEGVSMPGFEGATALEQRSEGAGAWSLAVQGDLIMNGEGWTSGEGGIDPGIAGMMDTVMRVSSEGEVAIRPVR